MFYGPTRLPVPSGALIVAADAGPEAPAYFKTLYCDPAFGVAAVLCRKDLHLLLQTPDGVW